jgi:murein DD-endopeptidase MepM/ murein hydrolase activator NlpD
MPRPRPVALDSLLAAAALVAAALLAATRPALATPPDGAGGGRFAPPGDSISPATYRRIGEEVERNVALLGLSGFAPEGAPAFAWPLAPNGIGYFSFHGIAGYVDHDLDIGELSDYECGIRTYDTPEGYNHRGVDIFPWPYSWLVMDEDLVAIVAAAPGTLVAKDDGHFDRRCACVSDDPNYVVVEHADGSRAWYLHLKSGSVTSKGVGQAVATGEVLGTIGSSGCSSGVHLHFEVHDSGSSPGPLLDPFDGPCNGSNPGTLWIDQPPYRDPTINHASTHSAPPVFPACPNQETPNEKRLFAAGDDIYVVVFLHDETNDREKDVLVRRPDGTVFFSASHTTPVTYDASYWTWWWTGTNPITAGPSGRWSWEVTFDGATRKRAFWVGAVFADDFEDANLAAWSATSP